jgi:hypothetical protein
MVLQDLQDPPRQVLLQVKVVAAAAVIVVRLVLIMDQPPTQMHC